MQLLKSLVLATMIVPTFLVADASNHHVAIGTRPMSEEATAQLGAEKDFEEAAEEEEGTLEIAGYIFDRYPPIYYSNSHHWLSAVTVFDDKQYTLELEDGSVWKTSNYNGTTALNWLANDPLTITQNNRWFSNYEYRIINQSNGTFIQANLFLGPIEQGQYSRYIVGIDHTKREIMLSDNSHWEISYLDASIFKDWTLNDYIIIGTNSNTSIWDSSSDALLINVNLNNSTRAKQY